jgi:hypothetical protein
MQKMGTILALAALMFISHQPAEAAFQGFPRVLKLQFEFLRFDPVLLPSAQAGPCSQSGPNAETVDFSFSSEASTNSAPSIPEAAMPSFAEAAAAKSCRQEIAV